MRSSTLCNLKRRKGLREILKAIIECWARWLAPQNNRVPIPRISCEAWWGPVSYTHLDVYKRQEVERAVRETAGETLWFAGRRAHVYYTQHCGGVSEPASAVWPEERASYLAGQHTDPYCLRRSPAQWQTRH